MRSCSSRSQFSMILYDTVSVKINISKHIGQFDLLLGLAPLELLDLDALAPQQLALLLLEDVNVVLARDLVVGGLPLQGAASLIALCHHVMRDLVFRGLPAIVLELVAIVYSIVGVLLQRFSLSHFMPLQDEGH